jgi:hypothetical protein
MIKMGKKIFGPDPLGGGSEDKVRKYFFSKFNTKTIYSDALRYADYEYVI